MPKATKQVIPKKFEMLKAQKERNTTKFEMSKVTKISEKPKFEMLGNKAAGNPTGYF